MCVSPGAYEERELETCLAHVVTPDRCDLECTVGESANRACVPFEAPNKRWEQAWVADRHTDGHMATVRLSTGVDPERRSVPTPTSGRSARHCVQALG
jgi:hypothetical protein